MDVHPPHEPIRSWKDFLLHLLTITIGLLIALALEAGVEAIHHRHMVRDAHANLRREIAANHRLYSDNLRSLEADLGLLSQNIDQLRELRAGRPPQPFGLHWSFAWNSYGDSAWRSARDLGAVAYMEPRDDEEYSAIYGQQTFVNAAGAQILFDEAKAAAPQRTTKNHADPAELTPADVQAMMNSAAELAARLDQLKLTMRALDDAYVEALRQP